MFPKFTAQDIIDFETKYRNSDEEITDVLELYERFNGDLFMMSNYIMCSDDEDAEKRICNIIDKAIKDNTITSTPTYKNHRSNYLKQASKRIKKLQKKRKSDENNNTSNTTNNTNTADTSNLASLILANSAKRSADGIAYIAHKYGIHAEDEPMPDISDADFEALQAKVCKPRVYTKKANKSK